MVYLNIAFWFLVALVEALERAHSALIGYLPGHRNDIADAAISHCEQALAAHSKQGGVV